MQSCGTLTAAVKPLVFCHCGSAAFQSQRLISNQCRRHTKLERCSSAMLHYFSVTLLQCHTVAVSRSRTVTLLQCHVVAGCSAAVSQCCIAAVSTSSATWRSRHTLKVSRVCAQLHCSINQLHATLIGNAVQRLQELLHSQPGTYT